jgi:hypothetical protein
MEHTTSVMLHVCSLYQLARPEQLKDQHVFTFPVPDSP